MSKRTSEQQAFIDALKNTSDSITLKAVAGSGKTTTSVSGVTELSNAKPMATFICVAFNKSIADELATRMPPTVVCRTMNAVGHRAWAKVVTGPIKLDTRKTFLGFRECFGKDFSPTPKIEDIYRLIDHAKANGIIPGGHEDDNALWDTIITHHDLAIDDDMQEIAIDMCREVLKWSIKQAKAGLIDFSDQLYMPVNFNGVWPKFDNVLIDEAQDISPIQRLILHNITKDDGRLFAVGDPNQAIYGFRGADHESIDALTKEFKTTVMGLTYCFRCSRSVINEARKFVPEIQCPPGTPEGMVADLKEWTVDGLNAKSAVICRNTKPLVELAFRLIRRGVSCYVFGRDLGFNLEALIKRMKAGSVEILTERLNDHLHSMRDKYMMIGKPERYAALEDRVETIMCIIENLPDPATIPALSNMIKQMFSGIKNGLPLMTIHKAKGLEFETVYFLDPELIPSRYATQSHQVQQEMNLAYVGRTRAILNLFYVRSGGLK